jgi:hypothetical protein
MPVAHYPSDEPNRDERAPDLDELVEEILGGGGSPSSPPSA